jgi:hypothetical protein
MPPQAKSSERTPLLALDGYTASPANTDLGTGDSLDADDVYDQPPEDAASCCSKVLFCFIWRLLRKGGWTGWTGWMHE